MHALKHLLFAELRKINQEDLTDEQMNNVIFHNPAGLRLTLNGFVQVKTIFTAYSFEISESIKSKHRQALSKLEYPYFLTRRRLVVFSEVDAMMIKLQGGVENFLESCSKID